MEYNFFFCEICNRNQVKNKRHIYSKKHREKLDFLLSRQNEVHKYALIYLKKNFNKNKLKFYISIVSFKT